MTATPSIDPALTRTLDPGEFLHDQLAQASLDLMRELLATFVNALLGADTDAVCGAAYYNRTPERVNSRNGKVLENAGLISRGRVRQTRPCRLEAAALQEAVSWIEAARQVWADRLDRLDAHLQQAQRR